MMNSNHTENYKNCHKKKMEYLTRKEKRKKRDFCYFEIRIKERFTPPNEKKVKRNQVNFQKNKKMLAAAAKKNNRQKTRIDHQR